MRKQIFISGILTLLLTSTIVAQKNNTNKSDPQSFTPPQISLEQRLSELSKDISDELSDKQKTTIAIANFVDLSGNVSDFGKFLAEELITRLYKTKKLKIVERQRLDNVITEQKLSLTELIEASSAKRIGRILGVDAIVAGSITELGNNFRVNARIISTETGELLAAAGTTIAKDQEVCSLISCNSKSNLSSRVETEPSAKSNVQLQSTPVLLTEKNVVKPVAKTTEGDFSFTIQSCKFSGQTVTCYIEITNLAEIDLNVWFRSDSQIIDDDGQSYDLASVELGNRVASTDSGYLLISKISVKGLISFKGVKSSISQIRLLRFNCLSSQIKKRVPGHVRIIEPPAYSPFQVDFRDIVLIKEN